MRNRLLTLLLVISAAGWVACSNSNGPAPTIAGTWHVAIGTMNTGTITPTNFDVTLTASKDTFLASVPDLTWTGGPTVYDTLTGVSVVLDSQVSIIERTKSSTRVCDYVVLGGRVNAARDTLHNAFISVEDTDMTGTYLCVPKAEGNITAHK